MCVAVAFTVSVAATVLRKQFFQREEDIVGDVWIRVFIYCNAGGGVGAVDNYRAIFDTGIFDD